MFRLSTKGRYGARLMLDLACNFGKGPVLLKDIAERQEISLGYLEHLVPFLKTAGLVNSTRGARGGYTLARRPSRITLKEVLRVMEGPFSPAKCIDSPSVCRRVGSCVTREIWKELGETISDFLESITLKAMVKKEKDKEEGSLSYNI